MQKAKTVAKALLAWFAQEARDLPWRHTRDPYAIWVSEIMLQQTQVKTVIPYWERWMREMPTVTALAQAPQERVLKLWEGLGYYTRARNLQKAANVIVTQHGGRFPRKFEDVLALPGIGRYTAGAICSIAFDEPTPILDGNVIRVLCRLMGIDANPREKNTNAQLWTLAEALVIEAHQVKSEATPNCSHLNQSLMELGALICTPKQPQCLICPVQTMCVAYREKRQEELPNFGERQTVTARRFIALIITDQNKFLVRQRPAGVVNAHLWEFPNFEVELTKINLSEQAQQELGLLVKLLEPLITIKHSITRYRITLEVFRVEVSQRASLKKLSGEWLTLSELEKLAFSSAHRKILRKLSTD